MADGCEEEDVRGESGGMEDECPRGELALLRDAVGDEAEGGDFVFGGSGGEGR